MSLIPKEEGRGKIYTSVQTSPVSWPGANSKCTSPRGALDSLGLMPFSRENQREYRLQLLTELLS